MRFARDMLIAMVLGTIAGLTAAALTGCTPAQQQLASNAGEYTELGLRFAACAQAAIAEDERRKLNERHEAAQRAEEEAEAIREAAREHPGAVSEEVEKVLKDGAK